MNKQACPTPFDAVVLNIKIFMKVSRCLRETRLGAKEDEDEWADGNQHLISH